MPYTYLIFSVFMNASSSVFGKIFNSKNDKKRIRRSFIISY